MKKIMFNDRFGLTDAVLQARKTVTRRIIAPQPQGCLVPTPYGYSDGHYTKIVSQYQVGEIVAIAQSLQNIGLGDDGSAAWTNKMFVKAEMMPHKIEILDVRVERLQDITDEDCIKEGIMADEDNYFFRYDPNGVYIFGTPREAFAELIDKVGKKGTWESNPYVFRYEFKLK